MIFKLTRNMTKKKIELIEKICARLAKIGQTTETNFEEKKT